MPYQTFIKNYNERRVLTLLRLEGPLSRTDIARRVKLPKSTITEMMERLIASGHIVQTASRTRQTGAGRPGVRVALNPQSALFLGVEAGVRHLRFALVDLGLNVVRTHCVPLTEPLPPQEALEEIRAYVEVLNAQPEFQARLQGVGVSLPGLVRADGYVFNLSSVNAQAVNFTALAEETLGTDLPIMIQNDANAAALGQVYLAPTLAEKVFLSLRINEGCGGAAIIHGRLLNGSDGVAAEFGHLRMGGTGPRCICGGRGCLEPHVNLAALATAMRQTAPVPAEVAALARVGDERAVAAVQHLTRHLEAGLISLTNIFNPSEIILGGSMADIYEVTLQELSQGVARGIVSGMPVPRLLITPLGEYECAIGAAAVVHQSAFDAVGMAENLGR